MLRLDGREPTIYLENELEGWTNKRHRNWIVSIVNLLLVINTRRKYRDVMSALMNKRANKPLGIIWRNPHFHLDAKPFQKKF